VDFASTTIKYRFSDGAGRDGHGVQKRSLKMKQQIMKFIREEDGLTTVEYAIAGALVGAAVIAAFTALGVQVGVVIQGLVTALT
jgi:pilus assembly protein Flp/PilA